MSYEIETRVESARGCGYRRNGLYLVGGKLSSPCGKLPIELSICPCCSGGIKQVRGFTWVNSLLVESSPCNSSRCSGSGACSAFFNQDKYGLLWVGEKFYKNASDFTQEAAQMGVSKRISTIPRDLVVGKTWILLAHPKAISEFTEDPKNPVIYKKGIFSAFVPERIEYVVKGTESPDELENMAKRGITLVNVIRDKDAQLELTAVDRAEE